MSLSDFIALLSLLISSIALIYTFASNTKRFELSDQYKQDLLTWYQDTIRVLLKIRGRVAAETFDWKEESDLLFLLSAQIEIGRFYLPNYQTEKGPNEPLAYRGNRHPALDCLVNVYTELKHPKHKNQNDYIKNMQMRFTSVMFKVIDPVLWNKQRAKTIKLVVPTDYCKSELQETYGNR